MGTLNNDIEKLKHRLEHTSSKSNKRDIYLTLQSLIESLKDIQNTDITYTPHNLRPEFVNKLDFNNKKELFIKYSEPEYRKSINLICKKALSQLKPYYGKMYLNETISFKFAKELIIDFFNQFDKNLYPLITQCLDEEHLFAIMDLEQNGDGYSLYNPYSNTPYIALFIGEKLKLDNISCLVHEIGHTICSHNSITNPKSFNKTVYNSFIEMPSFTFEFLFLDFLRENKIYELDTEKTIHNNLSTLNYYVGFLKTINRIINELNICKDYTIKENQKILRAAGIVVSDIYCELCLDDITKKYFYSYGELIGFYYLSKYKNDKEKTKYNITNFINNIGIYEDLDMLNQFGINFEEFQQCNYLKQEIERNQKQLTKNSRLF